jgi:hypothetical protein
MGWFSDLFGGDDETTVTQSSSNNTDVTVQNQVANLIDLSALASAIEAMGQTVGAAVGATANQTQSLIAQLSAANLVVQARAAAEKAKENEIVKTALDKTGQGVKIMAIGLGGFLIYREFFK